MARFVVNPVTHSSVIAVSVVGRNCELAHIAVASHVVASRKRKIDLFAVAGQCGLLEFRHSCDEVLGGLWDATAN